MQNELYVRKNTLGLIYQIPQVFDKWYTSQHNCDSVYKNADSILNKTIGLIIKKGVEMISSQGVYSIDENIFIDKYLTGSLDTFFEALDFMKDKIFDIEGREQSEREYRWTRKENRGKVIGGGFGLKGAIKGMATAGAMNATTGMMHSLGNALGNMGSSISASQNKAAVYKNSREPLKEALILCALHVQDGIRDALKKEANVKCKKITSMNINQAGAIVKNYRQGRIPDEQKLKQIVLALSLNPYEGEVYDIIWDDYKDKNGELRKMAAYFGDSLEQRIREKSKKYGETLFTKNCSMYENAFNKQKVAMKCEEQIRITLNILIKYCKDYDIQETDVPVMEKCRQLLKSIDHNIRTVHGNTYETRELAERVASDYRIFYKGLSENFIFDEQTYDYILSREYCTEEFKSILNPLFDKEKKRRTPENIYENIFEIIKEDLGDSLLNRKWIDIPNYIGDIQPKEITIRTITEMPNDEIPLLLFNSSSNGKSGILITNYGLRIYSKGLLSNTNQFYPIDQIEMFECIGINVYAIHIYNQEILKTSIKQKNLDADEQIALGETITKIIRLISNLLPESRKQLHRILDGTIICECGMHLFSNETICPSCKKMRKANGEFVEARTCPYCNAIIPGMTKFCPICGNSLTEKIIENSNSSGENISDARNKRDVPHEINSANDIVDKKNSEEVANNGQQHMSEMNLKESRCSKKRIYSFMRWGITILFVLLLWSFVKHIAGAIFSNSSKNAPSSVTRNLADEVEDTSNPDEYGEGIKEENGLAGSNIGSEGDDEDSAKFYIRDPVSYDEWGIYVNYAYTVSTYVDKFYVKVNCEIRNESNSTREFSTSEFSLNNGGIIKETVGSGGYEYTKIAPDGSFNTDIEFLCPNNSNRVLDNMTMIVGDVSVCLAYRPQEEELRNKFFGVYISRKGTGAEQTMMVAPTESEGMYCVTDYLYSSIMGKMLITNEDYFTLDDKNLFKCGGLYYKWVPEEQRIYNADDTGAIEENRTPLEKQ